MRSTDDRCPYPLKDCQTSVIGRRTRMLIGAPGNPLPPGPLICQAEEAPALPCATGQGGAPGPVAFVEQSLLSSHLAVIPALGASNIQFIIHFTILKTFF